MTSKRALLRHATQLALASATGALRLPAAAAAPPFPTRAVRIFTPFPAGSGPDAALRLVGEQLSRRWKQPVIVDNCPGGNGFIAVAALKQGATDGHDLLQLDSTHTTSHPSTFARLPYKVQADFAPLRMILRTPFFVTVGARSPYRSLEELIADARARPGRLSYGSWFNGSPGHLAGLLLQSQQRIRMLHVPFRDFGQLYTSVANGEVDWAMGSVATAAAMQQAGRIRFLTLASKTRDPLYPAVPCTAESPVTKGFELSAWTGVFGPASIAGARQEAIAADMGRALAAADVVQSYKTLGYAAPDLNPTQFDALIRRETIQWASVIQAAQLQLD